MKDWHIDIVLKKQLIAGWQEPDQLGACYVVPPVGSFIEHETGCSADRPGRIAGMFGVSWCQEGTRKRGSEQVHRRLAAFSRKGRTQWLCRAIHLPLSKEELKWRTERPPSDRGACLSAPANMGVWAEPAEEREAERHSMTLRGACACTSRVSTVRVLFPTHVVCRRLPRRAQRRARPAAPLAVRACRPLQGPPPRRSRRRRGTGRSREKWPVTTSRRRQALRGRRPSASSAS